MTIDIQFTSINMNIYVFVDHWQYEMVANVAVVNFFGTITVSEASNFDIIHAHIAQ